MPLLSGPIQIPLIESRVSNPQRVEKRVPNVKLMKEALLDAERHIELLALSPLSQYLKSLFKPIDSLVYRYLGSLCAYACVF